MIGQLTHEFWPSAGGIQSHVALIAQGLARRGFQCAVLTPLRDVSAPRREACDGYEVVRFRSSCRRHLQGLAEATSLRSQLAREPFDILHYHGLCWAALTAILSKRTPGVVTVHSDAHLPAVDAWRGRLGLTALRRAWAVVAVARHLRRKLVASGLPSERILVLHNPVDTSTFCPVSFSERVALRRRMGMDSRPTVIYLGRLAEVKGADVLCDAWRRVVAARSDVRLLVVGDGPERPRIQRLAGEFGDAPVHLLGSRRDVVHLLQMADMLMLPSYREGLPCCLVEAAACGLPVVATATEGASEVVADGVTGRLTGIGDAAALADAALRILADEGLRDEMGRAARRLAEDRWSLDVALDRLLSIYDRALGAKWNGSHRPGPRDHGGGHPVPGSVSCV